MGVSTFISFVLFIGFAIYGNKFNERVLMVVGMCVAGSFYFISFPWPFFTGNLTFKSPAPTPTNFSLTNFSDINQLKYESTGCDQSMEWCHYTPKLPLLVYLLSYPLMSIGLPISNVAVSTLYSKILGPRKQGWMQSVMNVAGSAARFLGPILISVLFEKFGPRIAWLMTSGVITISICTVLVFFYSLRPLEMKPKMASGDKLRYDGGILYHF